MKGHSEIERWEEKAQVDLDSNQEIFGSYPPVADIQSQMWTQLTEHMTEDEALEFMHTYFPDYQHVDEPPPAA